MRGLRDRQDHIISGPHEGLSTTWATCSGCRKARGTWQFPCWAWGYRPGNLRACRICIDPGEALYWGRQPWWRTDDYNQAAAAIMNEMESTILDCNQPFLYIKRLRITAN